MQGSTLKGVILGNLGDLTGTTLRCSRYSSGEHRLTLVKSEIVTMVEHRIGRLATINPGSIPRGIAPKKISHQTMGYFLW